MNNISYVIIACYPDKGMKSYGSQGLMVLDKKKLLDHQIAWISKLHSNKNHNYEIIIICDFDSSKVIKTYANNNIIKIIENTNNNPVHVGALNAKFDQIVYIDYGCLFNPKILLDIDLSQSCVVCTNNAKQTNLEVGLINNLDYVEHMFFDLPNNKFCNIFYVSPRDRIQILNNANFHKLNLLYFEIINLLIHNGCNIKFIKINNKDFIFFNHIKQKTGATNFVKKLSSY
jgi:hypothetical protein